MESWIKVLDVWSFSKNLKSMYVPPFSHYHLCKGDWYETSRECTESLWYEFGNYWSRFTNRRTTVPTNTDSRHLSLMGMSVEAESEGEALKLQRYEKKSIFYFSSSCFSPFSLVFPVASRKSKKILNTTTLSDASLYLCLDCLIYHSTIPRTNEFSILRTLDQTFLIKLFVRTWTILWFLNARQWIRTDITRARYY